MLETQVKDMQGAKIQSLTNNTVRFCYIFNTSIQNIDHYPIYKSNIVISIVRFIPSGQNLAITHLEIY